MTDEPLLSISELLAHRPFLERLALRLTGERERADDLVQDTWLKAIERPPRHGANLSAWLQRVARHLHYRRKQRDATWKTTELDPILPADDGPAEELAERSELLRRIADLTLRLEEPYRGVLLLRFYDGKTPTQIASQLGRPVNTVTSQLARGLQQLRVELDRQHGGDRSRWSRALLPLALRGRRGANAPLRMSDAASRSSFRRMALSAGALLSTGLAAVFLTILLPEWRSSSKGPAAEGVNAAPLASRMPAAVVDAVPSQRERVAVASEPDATATLDEPPPDHPPVVLEVVDSAGAPIADARILAMRGPAPMGMDDFATEEGGQVFDNEIRYWSDRGRTDAQGRASVAVSREMVTNLSTDGEYVGFVVDKPGFVRSSGLYVPFPPRSAEPHRVLLASPSFTARGQVIDPEGAPIAGAMVFIGPEKGGRNQEGDTYRIPEPMGRLTDARGCFETFGLAPGAQTILIQKEGFLPLMDSVDEGQANRLFVLQRGATLTGYVVDKGGDAVAGALVWAEFAPPRIRRITERTTSDADGVYELKGIAEGMAVRTFAQHPSDPQLIDSAFLQFVGSEVQEWLPELDRRPPLRVRVRTDDDEPIQGATVCIKYSDWATELVTDDEGRASIHGIPDVRYLADVILVDGDSRPPPCLASRRVVLGERENSLVVPRKRLENGAIEALVTVSPEQRHAALSVLLRPIDGTALSGYLVEGTPTLLNDRVPPQTYDAYLHVERLGTLSLGQFEVRPGEKYVLGPILVPAVGAVEVDWRWPGDASQYTYQLLQLLEIQGKWKPTDPAVSGQGPVSGTLPALPGRFEWSVWKRGTQVEKQIVDVRSNAIVRVSTGVETGDEKR